jgi:hypothetical protein
MTKNVLVGASGCFENVGKLGHPAYKSLVVNAFGNSANRAAVPRQPTRLYCLDCNWMEGIADNTAQQVALRPALSGAKSTLCGNDDPCRFYRPFRSPRGRVGCVQCVSTEVKKNFVFVNDVEREFPGVLTSSL